MSAEYTEFLEAKTPKAAANGIAVSPSDLNPALFPFQADIVSWALRRGRAAIFADCGMGKTPMQLEWACQINRATDRPILILAPLAVAEQTVAEGRKFGIPVEYRRTGNALPAITVTNYEMLQHFDPDAYAGIVLDESSILKAYDGKTRTAIIDAFRDTPYKLACTATPAPNDYMELGNHSEFLGAMTRAEMLAMFFVHDGGETQKWRLKRHGRKAFWRWLSSCAVSLRKPSDLGYDDDGFVLPELKIVHHEVPDDGDGPTESLFKLPAQSLMERRSARRSSLSARIDRCAALVAENPGESWLIWCNLNAEGDGLEAAIPGAIQIAGADSLDTKEQRIHDFVSGQSKIMVSKSSIMGFGLNLQHCHNMIFCGLDDSWESYYQAIRRVWRFGQTKPVTCHIVTGEMERAVVENVKRKEKEAVQMADEMVKSAAEDSILALRGTHTKTEYRPEVRSGESWALHIGDAVELAKDIPSESIDYSIFSPPFASLYTYSDSDRDMGNCKTHADFEQHLRYLIPELFRVTKPGRLLSFHCMNLPTSKARDGVIGITDFRGMLIRAFADNGWIYHSEVVIWKDPVTAMQRTKALGLLYKQLRKDSAMSRQGIPDYLVTMRKPGENTEPVTKTHDSFPVSLWQRYASPVWMDINPSKTLQFRSARSDEDERHICPLQLEVIERCVELWTNPGDTVLSPFAGIGSEGYTAVSMGRRFVGIELKPSYADEACRNLDAAERAQAGLFADVK